MSYSTHALIIKYLFVGVKLKSEISYWIYIGIYQYIKLSLSESRFTKSRNQRYEHL